MPVRIEKLPGSAFLSFPEMSGFLETEIGERFNSSGRKRISYGDLLYYPDWNCTDGIPYWSRTAMLDPFLLHFDSISDAAGALKAIQRNWASYQYQLFRRAGFIQEKLPYINLKIRKFPLSVPHSPVGLYTLIDENTLIASAVTSSSIPAGSIQFEEDHESPPSRAYLKLQESLSMAVYLFGVEFPGKGQRCFDAGACPGGWTWVLTGLGSSVLAVDRSELAPELMANPLVTFQAHDAFTLKPQDLGVFDWVFSDVICYPERLYAWVQMWLESGLTRNMICTIKMQGSADWNTVSKFAGITDSRVVHLNYNKHELTWIHCQKKSPYPPQAEDMEFSKGIAVGI